MQLGLSLVDSEEGYTNAKEMVWFEMSSPRINCVVCMETWALVMVNEFYKEMEMPYRMYHSFCIFDDI